MRTLREIRSTALAATLAGAMLCGLAAAPAHASNALDRNGMWIWYVSRSSGGSLSEIVHKARHYGIGTVIVKSGDGTDFWSQFSSTLIRTLHAGGLKVCGWQYVYGDHPKDEARVAAHGIAKGADCFVIDAESQYEGRYSAARKYVRKLRDLAGKHFPIALAGFPYVDYHPAFPYSVFLGPGGAQYNVPQAYWKAIGTSANAVLDHTYLWNLPYDRPIRPLGQVYDHPDRRQIMHFRKYVKAEGDHAESWWDWQEAGHPEWRAVSDPLSGFGHRVVTSYVKVSEGMRGDIVYWAQLHLAAAGESLQADGDFGSHTKRAVKRFQGRIGLSRTGSIDSATWTALLSYSLSSRRHAKALHAASAAAGTPKSARLPAKRYEIPRSERRPPAPG